MKDEIERLKSEKGGSGSGTNNESRAAADDPYLKEELHQAKLELKDAKQENRDLK